MRSVGTELDELEERVELRAGVKLLELDIIVVLEEFPRVTMNDVISLCHLYRHKTSQLFDILFFAPDIMCVGIRVTRWQLISNVAVAGM